MWIRYKSVDGTRQFLITANDTAFVTAYLSENYDMTAYNIPNGTILDNAFQEIDIETGEVSAGRYLPESS